jgi:hypothetical protein
MIQRVSSATLSNSQTFSHEESCHGNVDAAIAPGDEGVFFPKVCSNFSSCLGTLCNQVRETRPLQIGITIVIDRVVVYAEHALHVLTYLPSGIELVLALRVGCSFAFVLSAQFRKTSETHQLKGRLHHFVREFRKLAWGYTEAGNS